MTPKYFGTDGIRGAFGGDILNESFLRRSGYALARFLLKHNPTKPVTVVIGRDTRASGEEIEQYLCEGLCAHGVHAVLLGVVPTPAVSMIVRELHADLGIAVTASHNPARDNGFKLFDNRGLKFTIEAELEIESFIENETMTVVEGRPATCGYAYDGESVYINNMKSLLHQNCIEGWKVVLDTANGATTKTSPAALKHFGAQLVLIGDAPNGNNINEGVGSEHPQLLSQTVLAEQAAIGIAHDGDGDRLVVCDELGQIVNGDQVLGILALDALKNNQLKNKTLVATVQSNFGLDKCIAAAGGRVERVGIGDRNVLLRMVEAHHNVGGENSGHIILRDYGVAGDGLLAAITLIRIMHATGKPLSALREQVSLFPQLTQNLKVQEKRPLEECENIQTAISGLTETLSSNGRLLVRYSGTESKLRLLVEAEDENMLQSGLQSLIEAAQADLEVIP